MLRSVITALGVPCPSDPDDLPAGTPATPAAMFPGGRGRMCRGVPVRMAGGAASLSAVPDWMSRHVREGADADELQQQGDGDLGMGNTCRSGGN